MQNHNSCNSRYVGVASHKILSLLSTLKRDSITILADILRAMSLSKPSKKMALVYRANLNFERIGKYLDFLATAGLIVKTTAANESESYRISSKGREFLVGYSRLIDSLKTSAIAAVDSKDEAEFVSPT